MTVKNNYVNATAMLGDWHKNVAPGFQPMRSKNKNNHTLYAQLQVVQVIARDFDWFIELFAPVVIGHSNYFGIGFSKITWKPL